MYSEYSPTSSSSSSDSPVEFKPDKSQLNSTEKCAICGNLAFCYNYGVLSCNACKMFFRRVEVDRITYHCKYWDRCYDGQEFVNVKKFSKRCRACRYQRCLQVGMKYICPGKLELELLNRVDDETCSLIKKLLLMDSNRRHKIANFYTPDDLTLVEIVKDNKKSRMVTKSATQMITVHDWTLLGLYVTIEMFLSIEFMGSIDNEDKIILLRNFSFKSVILNSAMRSYSSKVDRVTTPDGIDVYPDFMLRMFSPEFVIGIRSRLIARLAELKVTDEEHMLLNVLLFCDAALHNLSEKAVTTLSKYQQMYSSVLLQYCLHRYQHTGPSRFADLLSVCHVVNRASEDVQHLTTIIQLHQPKTAYKQLFVDVCHRL